MAIRVIVTDIEGTTSSLSFVKDVLFPHARRHMAEFIREHGDDPKVRDLLDQAKRDAGDPNLSDDDVTQTLIRWIDEDRKVTPLKGLQGLIWEDGYRQGHFTGHIYDDAVLYLRRWHEAGIRLYVFSSGSVFAQKLLFGHTDHGDLTPLFDGYFDTHVGAKREPSAYSSISNQIGVAPAEILFLSDIREELDAARSAGMQTCLLARDGLPDDAGGHATADSFEQVRL